MMCKRFTFGVFGAASLLLGAFPVSGAGASPSPVPRAPGAGSPAAPLLDEGPRGAAPEVEPAPAPDGVVWGHPTEVAGASEVVENVDRAANGPVPATASQYVGTQPTRVLDTRRNLGAPGPVAAGGTVSVPIAGLAPVPVGASAAVINVTVTATAGWGYVTAYPAGVGLPVASSLNVERPDQTMANLVTVPLGAGGAIELFASVGMHLIADVQGYYVPVGRAARSGRFVPTEPARIVDTRQPGSPLGRLAAGADVAFAVPGLPAGADSAVLKLTVTDAGGGGFWTLYPAGSPRPDASNLNTEFGGQTIASQAIVRADAGSVRAFTNAGGHLIVDLVGYYTGDGAPNVTDGLFVPVAPGRLIDTREGYDQPGPRRTIEVPVGGRLGVPAAGVAAVVTNLTMTDAQPGYASVWAARRYRPNTSALNAGGVGQTIAGHVITPVSANGFAVFTDAGADLLVDVTGWFAGDPVAGQLPVHVPLHPAAGPANVGGYNYSITQYTNGTWETGRSLQPGDVPVTWDPCRPIRYAVNASRYPQYIADIEEAVDRLAAATGLTFVSAGLTDFMPTDAVASPFSIRQLAGRTGTYDIVIALGDEFVTDLVDGATVGLAGVQWVWTGARYDIVHAPVIIDVPDVADASTWGGAGVGQVLLHELAHAVGLDHVFDQTQIMNPFISGVATFGSGDLRGLWDLGVVRQAC